RRPASKKMDALVLLAKATAGPRRRRSLTAFLVVVGIGLIVGALVIWWFMPGPPGAPLTLALYDQVALADEPVKLVAAVQPVAPAEEAEDLAGCVIHFTEFQSGLQQKAETDRLGLARCETRFP